MRDAEALGYAGRYQRLAPVVEATHDLAAMSAITLGSSLRTLSPSQRREFFATFRELSVSTYASRFDGYSGETFAVLGQSESSRPDRVTVDSRLTKANGDEVRFQYQMRRRQDRWRIINVVVDGVSDLATKRAEYRSIMKQEGFAPLISKIEDQIERARTKSKN